MFDLLVVPSFCCFEARVPFLFFGIKRETRSKHLFPPVIIPSMFFGHEEDPFPTQNFLLNSWLVIFGSFQFFRRICLVKCFHHWHELILLREILTSQGLDWIVGASPRTARRLS